MSERGNCGSVVGMKWGLCWRRGLFDWEKELEVQLLALFSTAKWNRDLLDGWLWAKGDTNSYTVGAGYTALKDSNPFVGGPWFKLIWKIKAASPALVCGWRAILGKLLTRDNLEKRQIVLLSNQCPLCNSTKEIVQHVLFECVVT